MSPISTNKLVDCIDKMIGVTNERGETPIYTKKRENTWLKVQVFNKSAEIPIR